MVPSEKPAGQLLSLKTTCVSRKLLTQRVPGRPRHRGNRIVGQRRIVAPELWDSGREQGLSLRTDPVHPAGTQRPVGRYLQEERPRLTDPRVKMSIDLGVVVLYNSAQRYMCA
ncbi:hypothetical protein EYF80_060403 [Liparis tanakae]|uniref:Uncharacterized protein n=1 Tax=Liparis tanakae TaxID=230148 RepID=A0A4Z2EKH4_9TELE|nr:hypothetical protein EYF80_060403 [Liparis tanakae]